MHDSAEFSVLHDSAEYPVHKLSRVLPLFKPPHAHLEHWSFHPCSRSFYGCRQEGEGNAFPSTDSADLVASRLNCFSELLFALPAGLPAGLTVTGNYLGSLMRSDFEEKEKKCLPRGGFFEGVLRTVVSRELSLPAAEGFKMGKVRVSYLLLARRKLVSKRRIQDVV